jgi:hypothetical protein
MLTPTTAEREQSPAPCQAGRELRPETLHSTASRES